MLFHVFKFNLFFLVVINNEKVKLKDKGLKKEAYPRIFKRSCFAVKNCCDSEKFR